MKIRVFSFALAMLMLWSMMPSALLTASAAEKVTAIEAVDIVLPPMLAGRPKELVAEDMQVTLYADSGKTQTIDPSLYELSSYSFYHSTASINDQDVFVGSEIYTLTLSFQGTKNNPPLADLVDPNGYHSVLKGRTTLKCGRAKGTISSSLVASAANPPLLIVKAYVSSYPAGHTAVSSLETRYLGNPQFLGKPDYDMTVTTEGVELLTEFDNATTKNGIRWSNDLHRSGIACDTGVFDSPENPMVELYLKAKDGYVLDVPRILKDNTIVFLGETFVSTSRTSLVRSITAVEGYSLDQALCLKMEVVMPDAAVLDVMINGTSVGNRHLIEVPYVASGTLTFHATFQTRLKQSLTAQGATATLLSKTYIDGEEIKVPLISPVSNGDGTASKTYSRTLVPEQTVRVDFYISLSIPGVGTTMLEPYSVTAVIGKKPVTLTDVALTLAAPSVGKVGTAAVSNTTGARVDSTVWERFVNGQWVNMTATDTFVDGAVYRAAMTVNAENGYLFADGLDATVSGIPATSYGACNSTTAVIYHEFTAQAPFVNICFNGPLPTQAVADNGLAASVSFETNYSAIQLQSASWKDVDGNAFTGTFQPGGKYTARFVIKPLIGSFDSDTVFKANGNSVTAVTIHPVDRVAIVEYTYWLGNSFISFNGLEAPLANTKALYPPLPSVAVSDNNPNIQISPAWLDGEGNAFTGTFKPGEKYTAAFRIEATGGGTIGRYSVIINGYNPTKSELIASNTRVVYYDFRLPDHEVYFTDDSMAVSNYTVAVDIEKTAEQSDAFTEALFNEEVAYQWYKDGEVVSGAVGESYRFTSADIGCEYQVMVMFGSQRIMSAPMAVVKEASTVLAGDINLDGRVNLTDAFAVYRAASGGATTADITRYGDMNGDGRINLTDAFAVYRIASGA